ncbi:hypothetical protein Ana3638_12415 [Anaerocolumna sedimenticola]|uniref:Uncharacterized protein n=1 Tax=Anaerocolumna sedimenticola TaxID=2696063 RepID=A0A6P1TNL5_9FIRM|nr:hypothetical protein [Anaerocolumna sedimenticola]QHQ61481.1 hypothetical protein Ana3638_12415 [Anaerocolumna sedimenticola]
MDKNVKEFDVNSLTEFIDLIDTEKLDNYYYRGENTKYKKIISSSLLREYSDTTKVNVLYGYKKLINQYYYEVANELSEVEKRHFVMGNFKKTV